MSEAETNAGLFTFNSPIMLAFPNLFEAKRVKRNGKETGEPKFSVNGVIPNDHPELQAFKDHIRKVVRAKWTDRPLSELKLCLSVGDKMADKRKEKSGKNDGDFQRGTHVLIARSKYRPALSALVDPCRLIEFTEENIAVAKKYFYMGVQGLMQVNCVAYDAIDEDAKPGVTAYLQSVLSLNKGARIGGGGAPASEVFKGYVGKQSAEDPTGGDDLMGAAPADDF